MEAIDLQRQVLDLLNGPPLSRQLTLVDLHSRVERPAEAAQLISEVLALIDPADRRLRKDVREEGIDAVATRLVEGLAVLNYKPATTAPAELKDSLAAPVPKSVLSVLHWLLSRLPELQKRAYVARFLRPFDLPDEYLGDEQVSSQMQLLRELQAEFKDVHKQVDKIRGTKVDPVALQREIEQLEAERGQLTAKMARLRERLRADTEFGHVGFDELLRSAMALRREQEEEARLAGGLEEQRQLLFESERRREDQARRLQALREASALDPAEMLDSLRAEVAELEETLEARLEIDVAAREQQLRQLQADLSGEPMSEETVVDLEREVAALDAEVAELSAERDRVQSSMDGQVGFYRDRATAVEKKREKLDERVREQEQELREAERELQTVRDELSRLSAGGQRPKTDAEVKAYVEEVTERTARYKAAKAELLTLANETRVLQRTEEVLRSRDPNIGEFNRYRETQATLEKVSAEKGQVDAQKVEALDEMSRMTEEFLARVRDRKAQLAPAIKAFRDVRNEFREVEREYLERKQAQDAVVAGLDADRIGLDQEVARQRAAVQAEESAFHLLQSARCLVEAQAQLVREEATFLGGKARLSSRHASHADLYAEELRNLEELSRTLRKEQKSAKEEQSGKVDQRRALRGLRDLLRAKLESQARENERQQLEGAEDAGAPDFIRIRSDGGGAEGGGAAAAAALAAAGGEGDLYSNVPY